MKKRLVAFIVLMCMVFAFCPGKYAKAEVSTSAEFRLETAHESGTFYTYDENGKKVKVEANPEDLTIKVYMTNCEASNVYSGIIELYYDETVLSCIGARSETGGMWVANPDAHTEDGKHYVRLAFSTGADVTEDGVILSAAFRYFVTPEEGEGVDFDLDVEQLCSDKQGDDKNVGYEIPEEGEYTYEYEEYVPEPEYLMGDANSDDKVNTADAVVVLKYSAGMLVLDEKELIQANVNYDDKVNTGDAVLILKYCVEIITEF